MRRLKFQMAATLIAVADVAVAATATVNLSWTIPTKRADGTALPVTEIKGYEVLYTIDDVAKPPITINAGTTSSQTVNFTLAPRASPYKTVWTIATIDTGGQKGPPSQAVSAIIAAPYGAPSAPSSFNLKVSCSGGQCSATVQ